MRGAAGGGLTFTTFAGAQPASDIDSDGILDINDNCSQLPNGPLASTYDCDDQEDGNIDGYGNPCDTDYNDNGTTDLRDIFDVYLKAQAASTDNEFDNNCNGAVDLADVNQAFNDAELAGLPGPSGLACAGILPCP